MQGAFAQADAAATGEERGEEVEGRGAGGGRGGATARGSFVGRPRERAREGRGCERAKGGAGAFARRLRAGGRRGDRQGAGPGGGGEGSQWWRRHGAPRLAAGLLLARRRGKVEQRFWWPGTVVLVVVSPGERFWGRLRALGISLAAGSSQGFRGPVLLNFRVRARVLSLCGTHIFLCRIGPMLNTVICCFCYLSLTRSPSPFTFYVLRRELGPHGAHLRLCTPWLVPHGRCSNSSHLWWQ